LNEFWCFIVCVAKDCPPMVVHYKLQVGNSVSKVLVSLLRV
jgi:hypothetical protein